MHSENALAAGSCALAHPVWRQVLALLFSTERTAGAIAEDFGISRSAVSEHLAILRHAGLVHETKADRERICSLNAEPLCELRSWLAPFEAYWKQQFGDLAKDLEGNDE